LGGFLSTITRFKDTWVVELEMLNGRKQNALGPILMIFILSSSKLIVNEMEEQFLIVFFEPLIQELEVLFVDRFNVNYNY
jgi:hypothetical protein